MNLSDPHELATLLEGILLAAGKPLSLERLAELFDEAERPEPCLLYTSDAADESRGVDLGGRHLI